MKTLENFLKKHRSLQDIVAFAEDLTLEQFLETCPRGEWILLLFVRTNPKSKREITLAAGHCADTVRHLMINKRSLEAVDAAIAYGEGRIEEDEVMVAALDAAADAATYAATAARAAYTAAYSAAYAAADAYAALDAAADAATYATYAAARAAADPYAAVDAAAYHAVKKYNQKLTANICRKYLPLEIWNQNEI